MMIDGVNSAMTALQFSQARSSTRAVETSEAMTTTDHSARYVGLPLSGRQEGPPSPERLILPATFHWGYRPTVVNGKRGAKRTPQFNDSAFWSRELNRMA